MAKETYIPPIKGISNEPATFREFAKGEFPVEIALRKNDFDYLGDWKILMGNDGYGVAYKLGTKEKVTDDQGDPATLVFHFYNLIAKKGLPMTPEKQKEQLGKLEQVVKMFTILGHHKTSENVIYYALPAPDWMVEELNNELKPHM